MAKKNKLEMDAHDSDWELISKIIEMAAELGWSVAIAGDPEDTVDHIIIGTIPALEEIDRTMDKYDILCPSEDDKKVYH